MNKIVSCHPLQPLDPEAADAMGAAFEAAWKELAIPQNYYLSMAESDLRVKLAQIILDLVKHGERDPIRLREFALASLGSTEALA